MSLDQISPGRACFTLAEFCESHRISRSKFYQLVEQQIGPDLMRIGNKVLITAEAAARWRAEREAESNPKAA